MASSSSSIMLIIVLICFSIIILIMTMFPFFRSMHVYAYHALWLACELKYIYYLFPPVYMQHMFMLYRVCGFKVQC